MVIVKTRGSSKLSQQERKELILNLCKGFSVLNSSKEVAEAITDLLTPKEVENIAKRLRIAELLVKGKSYEDIRALIKVGYSTIARINTWLNLSGEGFKLILSRKKESSKTADLDDRYDPYSWHNIKRRHTMYFWPELLIEELIKRSDKKEKEKINEIFGKLELKGRRFTKQENKRLYEEFNSELPSKEPT